MRNLRAVSSHRFFFSSRPSKQGGKSDPTCKRPSGPGLETTAFFWNQPSFLLKSPESRPPHNANQTNQLKQATQPHERSVRNPKRENPPRSRIPPAARGSKPPRPAAVGGRGRDSGSSITPERRGSASPRPERGGSVILSESAESVAGFRGTF